MSYHFYFLSLQKHFKTIVVMANNYFQFTFKNREFSIEWRYCESIEESAFVVHERVGDCTMFKGYFCCDWDEVNSELSDVMDDFGIWIDNIDRATLGCCVIEDEDEDVLPCVMFEVVTKITEKEHKVLSEKKRFFYNKTDALNYMTQQEDLLWKLFDEDSLSRVAVQDFNIEKCVMLRNNNDIEIDIKCITHSIE